MGFYYSKMIGQLKKKKWLRVSFFLVVFFFSRRKWVSLGSLFQNCKVSSRIGSSGHGKGDGEGDGNGDGEGDGKGDGEDEVTTRGWNGT